MKYLLPVLSALAVGVAQGQTLPISAQRGEPPTVAETRAQAQRFFDQYASQIQRSSGTAFQLLDETFARGLAPSAKNCVSIRQALTAKVPTKERALLARLLADQYGPDNPTGMNHLILTDLRNLINSADLEVAGAATIGFSGLGFFPDFEPVLRGARDRGAISQNTYDVELANVLLFAPSAEQARLAAIVRASKNEDALQIAAGFINEPSALSKLAVETRSALREMLEQMEPSMPDAVGRYDFAHGIRYANWLRALATLKGSDFNKQGAEIIMQHLNDPKGDPRKAMAFMISEFGPLLIAQIGDKTRFQVMLNRMRRHSLQHPPNRDMREIVEQVTQLLT